MPSDSGSVTCLRDWRNSSPSQPAWHRPNLSYAFPSTLSFSADAVKADCTGQLPEALLRLTGPILLSLGPASRAGRDKR